MAKVQQPGLTVQPGQCMMHADAIIAGQSEEKKQ
jgi:hypothetical protein